MTYKKIIDMIDNYENEYKTAFYINGDHASNTSKKKLLLDKHNDYLASLAALFDFVAFDKAGVIHENFIKDYFMTFNTDFTNKIEPLLNDIKNNKLSNKKLQKLNDEMQRHLSYEMVYCKVFLSLVELSDKKMDKIYKYADKKRNMLVKNEEQEKVLDDNMFVSTIYSELKKYYKEYNLALHEQINRKEHGGKNFDMFIERRRNASIMYSLLLSAINDAVDAKENNIGNKEETVNNYFDGFLDSNPIDQKYCDLDELKLTYKNTFNKTYLLSKRATDKLNKKINKLS